jgi:hypothetical protein
MRLASTRPIRSTRSVFRTGVTALLAATFVLATTSEAQLRREGPKALTDAEFWEFFTTMSEPGGSFLSENFLSNEMTFQDVIPTLKRSFSRDAVYLGVGPEQNFTYISNLEPRMAVIFDIRRQNAMQHLLYKAIFELSPTRADFVSRLFSRPWKIRPERDAKPQELFAAIVESPVSDSAYLSNLGAVMQTLTKKHAFALPATDISAIEYLYSIFFEAGPDINYMYRPGSRSRIAGPAYPNYGMLQSATNADSVQMAFLANETRYQAVRELHLRNLIVPVVGDFSGPSAIRSVGTWLRQRNMTVGAFYLSNVEQYLFQQAGSDRFYQNVATLPTDSTSMFIRSVPGGGAGFTSISTARFATGAMIFSATGGLGGDIVSMEMRDSGGVRTTKIVRDSAGTRITSVTVDSSGLISQRLIAARPPTAAGRDSTFTGTIGGRDSTLRAPFAIFPVMPTGVRGGGSGLTNGLASIQKTLDEFIAGKVNRYQDIIAMTKVRDWK